MRTARSDDDVRREGRNFRRVSANAVGFACAPTVLDPQVAADGPAQFLQPLRERRDADRCVRIVRGDVHEHADAPHALGLLRARRKRPRRRRAAEQRDELAPLHSITLSARPSSASGMLMPSTAAVLVLMES